MSDEKNPVVTGEQETEEQAVLRVDPEEPAASAEDAGGPGADELDDEFDDDEYERRHAEVDYGRVEFSYETREADVLDGVEISDRKNRVDAHRNFQLLGVFVVIWMFWGDLFKNNGTQTLVSWVMVIAALALLFLILKFPANNNRKYAARLKEHSPRFELAATRDGIDVREGGGKYYIAFSGSCSVYDYKGVYAICYDKNKVVAVPKNQLDEATAERFCGVLRQGLGDRFEKVAEDTRRPLFGKRK